MCRKPCHCGGRANLERWGWRLGGGEGGAGRARDGVKTFAQENTMELGLSVKVVFRARPGGPGVLEEHGASGEQHACVSYCLSSWLMS